VALDYIALVLLIVIIALVVYGVIAVWGIPYEIAKQRNHLHQDAIGAATWVSLLTLGVLWPFVPQPDSCTAASGDFFRSLRRRGRATSVARRTRHHRSLAQIASHSRDFTSQERGQDHVKDDHWPQKDAGETT
jgi:Protein of unknown function (DUF3302)